MNEMERKNNKIITKDVEQIVQEVKLKDNIDLIRSALVSISSSIGIIEGMVSKFVSRKKADEFLKEEALLEQKTVLEEKPLLTQVTSTKGEDSFSDLLKRFFTNPIVIAGLSGLAYSILPEETKEKLKALFLGLKDGLEDSLKEMDTFKSILVGVGVGLATYLGVKTLASLGEAIATVLAIIAKSGSILRRSLPGKRRSDRPGPTKNKSRLGSLGLSTLAIGAAGTGLGIVGYRALAGEPGDEGSTLGTALDRIKDTASSIEMPSMSSISNKFNMSKDAVKEVKLPNITGDDASVMEMIKKHEGVRYRPYKDIKGLWHIGVGHYIGKTLPKEYNREFTPEEVQDLFIKDYFKHKKAAENIPGYNNLDSKGKAALIDLTFNMGPNWINKWPKLKEQLASGDLEGAALNLENSLWYRQVGNRAPVVVSLLRGGSKIAPDTPMIAEPESKPSIVSETPSGINIKDIISGAADRFVSAATPFFDSAIDNKGRLLNFISEETDQVINSFGSFINNNIDASRSIIQKEGVEPPPFIPSPVANRGSLSLSSKHYSAN